MCVGLSNHSHNTNLKRGPWNSNVFLFCLFFSKHARHHWTLLVLTSHVVVMNHCELMFVCLCVTGGFRLKYAPSHISDGPDNADWRTRGGWRKFLRPRFHGGSLFPGSCLWAAWLSFCVRHHILWTGPTCQGLRGQSLSTRAWKKTFIPWGLLIAHANCPCDSKPHPLSVGFWYFCTEGRKWLTY